jgi:hypothetical protein
MSWTRCSVQHHLSKGCLFVCQILTGGGIADEERGVFLAILQKLCGACCLLPKSHEISDGLEIISPSPVAGGGFADVYKGSYNGLPVAIKMLRITVTEKDGLAGIKKV